MEMLLKSSTVGTARPPVMPDEASLAQGDTVILYCR